MTKRKDPRIGPQSDGATEQPEPFVVEPVAPVDIATEPLAQDDVLISSPLPETPPPAPPPPPARRSGIFAPLLGGALAAIGGFALSHFNVLGLSAADMSADVAAISARIDETAAEQATTDENLSGQLAALAARLDALESQPTAAGIDPTRLDAVEERLSAIEAMPTDGTGSNAAVTAKLVDLERRLTALPETGPSTELQAQLDEALARLDAAEAAAQTQAAEAEAATASANRAQALDTLAAAVSAGTPFAAELQALDDPELITALQSAAEAGVPTVASLQASFPDPAREALGLARDISAEDGWSDRLVDFLASQTGARSVTPREGSTPDAILSRAEFALSEARIADALAELDTLDPAVRAPLDPWIALAQAHLAASAALAAARGE